MLRLRVSPPARPSRSTRFASQLSHGQVNDPVKPSSILSRKSDRFRSKNHRNSGTEQETSEAPGEVTATTLRKAFPRATSFVSTRSAERRDHAAEKWFTGVRELDIERVDKIEIETSKPLSRKKRQLDSPNHHEMRPRTDLNALFTSATARFVTLLRVQTKKELGGDYTSYLPNGYADPHRLPVDYARLFLGRNKHIPLTAQTGALNVIEGAIRGKTTGPTA